MQHRSEQTDRFGNRGVSDLIAFVLMFSIIITGVGIVSLGAFGNLTEFAEREKVENSERGLTAMASTIDEFHRQSDTYRSEIKLALSGSSSYLNDSDMRIRVENPSAGTTLLDDSFDLNSTEQRFDRSTRDVVVSYEGGAVFRRPGFGARYQPSIRCETGSGSNVAIVSFVTLKASNFQISSGSGDNVSPLNPRSLPGESPVADLDTTLLFSARLDEQNRTRTYLEGSDLSVVVDVSDTANPSQWQDYFANDDSNWAWAKPEATCSDVDAVLIRQSVVQLSL